MGDERRPTAGARELRAYLSSTGQSLTGFCEEHELDRIQVGRAMKGAIERISVDFAHAIEVATKGRVKCHLWRSETRRAA